MSIFGQPGAVRVSQNTQRESSYEKLHPKGFEILGISFDNTKGKLTSFIKKENMTWPQYFDGKGWQMTLAALWDQFHPGDVVDQQKRQLVDMNARANLEQKVEALLAEGSEG